MSPSESIWRAHLLQPRFLTVSFGIVLATVLIWQGYHLLQEPVLDSSSLPVGAPAVDAGAQTASHGLEHSGISRLNLFGKFTEEKAAVDAAALPATTLNLELAGIIGSTFLHDSRCLISESGKPAKSYFVGDKLSGDVAVYRIDKDSIILQRGDQLEKLELHRGQIGKTVARRSLPSAAITETASTTPAVSATPSKPAYKDLEDRIAAIRKKSKI